MDEKDLYAVHDLKASIDAYKEELHNFQSLITVKTSVNDGMPKGSSGDSAVEWLAIRIADVTKKIDDLQAQFSVMAEKLEKRIRLEIDNVRAQTILILRYVDCMTFAEIAQAMSYSEKHIRRLHKNIIAGLKNGWAV